MNWSASASRTIVKCMRLAPLAASTAGAVVALSGRYRPATYTLKNTMRVRSAMPFNCSSCPSTRTRSSSLTPSSSAACSGSASINRSSLETVFDSRRAKRRARAARRVALHVDRHRVHGDVGGGGFDVHGERGRVPAQTLRTDPQQVDGLSQRRLELGTLRILAARAERPRRRDLGEVHAEIGGAAHADADDGRRAGLAAGLQHAVDDEGL